MACYGQNAEQVRRGKVDGRADARQGAKGDKVPRKLAAGREARGKKRGIDRGSPGPGGANG